MRLLTDDTLQGQQMIPARICGRAFHARQPKHDKVGMFVPELSVKLVEGIRDKQTVGITGSSKPGSARPPIVATQGASWERVAMMIWVGKFLLDLNRAASASSPSAPRCAI